MLISKVFRSVFKIKAILIKKEGQWQNVKKIQTILTFHHHHYCHSLYIPEYLNTCLLIGHPEYA